MSIIGIVAIDRNKAIGKGGKLPWHYSSDMKFFKQQTIGNACVMGHRTWLSLPKPLPDRLNIVLSRTSEIEHQPAMITLRDKSAVLSLNSYLKCDLYVIGGAQVYRTFLDDIDEWVVTEVPLSVDGADAFMPEGFLRGFEPYEVRDLDELIKVTFYRRSVRS
nr:Dihydrofolate reductase [uncultured bacterium]